MPVAATWRADVVARDLHPLVLGGGRQHPLQQLAVAGLQLGALVELPASSADPGGQRVADGLELAQVQRPRPARYRRHRGVDLQPREGLGDKGAELVLEAPDLAPQLGPREPLVATDPNRSARVSIQEIRHSPYRG